MDTNLSSLSILVLEDSEADYWMIRRSLRQGGLEPELHRVWNQDALAQALQERTWSMVLADCHMPELPLETALPLLQSQLAHAPLILVSGYVGEEHTVDLLRQGFWDCVLKDNLNRLPLVIRRCLREQEERAGRREAEQQLNLFAAALEAAANAVVITRRDGHIQWANHAFSQLTGYQRHEILGRNPRDLVHSGAHDHAFFHNLWDTILSGQVWQGETVNRRKDGSLYTEDQTITPLRDAQGQISHFIAIKQDISARKNAEASLQAHRDHLEELVAERTQELAAAVAQSRLILDSSADAIFGLDVAGCVSFTNPAACQLLGYRQEELLGQNLHALVHCKRADGSPYPEHDCHLVSSVRSGLPTRVDAEVYWRKDGEPIVVTYASQPLIQAGQLLGAVVSMTDSTLRHAAEEAREEARRAAEHLAKVKSEFLANMSHEIRTPLNAILGFAQVGQKEDEGRRAANLFERILDSGQLLMGLINDILDFSKIEAGKLALSEEPMDIGRVLDQVAGLTEQRAASKGIAFHVDEAPDLPASCLSDSLRVSQILLNLLSNAVKFTKKGEVRLSAACSGDTLLFAVTDTGIGMSQDSLARLFQPFEQADSSTTRQFGGTGLGLTISHRLAQLMGGEIQVDSTPNQGSRFEVRLPLKAPQGHIAPRSKPVSPISTDDKRLRLAGLRILAAEDNESNQLVLQELLSIEGAQLLCVDNGQEAVQIVRERGAQAFDILLTDIQMPLMDGHEAARQILAFAPTLPIVGLTAHALQEERERCFASGMVAHVAKPIDIDTLVHTILRHTYPERLSSETTPPVLVSAPASPSAKDLAAQIDWPALEQRYKNRSSFILRLVDTALKSAQSLLPQLRLARENQDFGRLAYLGHSLKGMAANLVAETVRQQAAELEAAAKQGSDDVDKRLDTLIKNLEQLIDELDQHKNTPPTEVL